LHFGQHTVRDISRKSLHKYHSSRVSVFGSAGIFFVIVCEAHGAMDLLRLPWQPQSAERLYGPDTTFI